jgi:polar amino acid transport system substrate-binding protein
VRKGDTATLEQLNSAIRKMKADGTLQQILQKWHMS